MISYRVAARAAGRKWLDRKRNLLFRLCGSDHLTLHGLKLPHNLVVQKLGVWFDELESEFLYKPRVFQMRYVARLIGRRTACDVVFEPRFLADAFVLLALLHRRRVRARVRVAPGEADWRLPNATRFKVIEFLKEATPSHDIAPMSEAALFAYVRGLADDASPRGVSVMLVDAPVDYSRITAPAKLSAIFLHHRVNQSGMGRLRTFLANSVRDRYFVDARISNDYQLLVRQRAGVRRY